MIWGSLMFVLAIAGLTLNLVNDLARHIRQSKVTSCVAIGQSFVV